jgi:hypothetical protein
MYRRQGSKSVLQGVLSGAYAGGRRRVDAAKLPRATRQRLADVLASRVEPAPILHDRAAGFAARVGPARALLASLLSIVFATAYGFANPEHPWVIQPRAALVVWIGAGALFAASLVAIVRRRALVARGALRPGRWLLPLDVVEIAPPDERGVQILTVTPLGDARDVSTARGELVLSFEGGETIPFPLRTDSDGEVALLRLEHSQRLLEELTYGRDIEKAHGHDAFFDVRVDDSWASVAPDDRARDASLRGRLVHIARRAAAPVAAALLAAIVGVGGFAARNRLSDRALYLRALREGTPAAFDAYLAKGHAYEREARAARDRILAAEADAKEKAARRKSTASDARPRPEWELTGDELAARRGTAEACISSLRLRASRAHPEVPRIMEGLVTRARVSGDPHVPIRFVRKEGGAHVRDVPDVDLASRERVLAWAFERVFSETCPASIVRFSARAGVASSDEAGLEIAYEVGWTDKTWTRPANPEARLGRETYVVRAMNVVFDVTLRGTSRETAGFRLTMPPPDAPSMVTRSRSLFVLGGAPAREGTFDDRVYAAMTARAFDRLYDEVYGLFFEGDPRVPLREGEEEEAEEGRRALR